MRRLPGGLGPASGIVSQTFPCRTDVCGPVTGNHSSGYCRGFAPRSLLLAGGTPLCPGDHCAHKVISYFPPPQYYDCIIVRFFNSRGRRVQTTATIFIVFKPLARRDQKNQQPLMQITGFTAQRPREVIRGGWVMGAGSSGRAAQAA